jgi:hypothetical protein
MSQSRVCRHSDVRDFDGLRCCLSCGLAVIKSEPTQTEEPPAGSFYKHQPLNHTFGQEVRLVELLPGEFDDELRCNIIHVNLAAREEHDYEAISYTWATEDGDASLSRMIKCGLHRLNLPISENCASALRRVRRRGSKRLIWIDMICIDQTNLEERNHQVRLMSTIYSKASKVVIYIGEADWESNFIFNEIAKEEISTIDHRDLRKFCSRRWFSRIWVIQEVAMARGAVVMAGDKLLHWDRFSDGLSSILSKHTHHELPIPIPPPLRIGTFYYLSGRDIASLLLATSTCSATDPRDKVYALLALISEENSIPLQPDYTQEAEWVFAQTAASIIAYYKDLSIIRCAYRSKLGTTEPDGQLSSWMPYWPTAVETRNLLYYSSTDHEKSSGLPALVMESGLPPPKLANCLDYPTVLGLQVEAQALGTIRLKHEQASDTSYYHGMKKKNDMKRPSRGGFFSSLFRDRKWENQRRPGNSDLRFWEAISNKTNKVFDVGLVDANLVPEWKRSLVIPSAFQVDVPAPDAEAFHNRQADDGDRTSEEASLKLSSGICAQDLPPGPLPQFDMAKLDDFVQTFKNCSSIDGVGQRVGFATKHSLGIGLLGIHDGDSVWRLGNEPQAYVLRLENDRYKFVSPCYVYGALVDRTCCEQERNKHWETITIW